MVSFTALKRSRSMNSSAQLRMAAPRRAGLMLEQLAEQRAVGQAGEMVVHGHLAELLVLGLELLEQLLDARAHGVQVLAQLAQLVALAPGQGRHRFARGQRAGLQLQAVDRPQQAQRQHAQQHHHADHHLRRHQPPHDALALREHLVDLGGIEAQAQVGHQLALVQHRRVAHHHRQAGGAALRGDRQRALAWVAGRAPRPRTPTAPAGCAGPRPSALLR